AAVDREVDHHDRVLLDDADQHDDADHGDDRQIHAEHHQHQQRADAGRGQAGNDGDRMDETFVEHSEHHVGREHGGQEQHPLAFERILEHLRRALEAGADRDWQAKFALDLLDGIDRLPQRIAGRQVERNGYRGLVTLVVDLQRADRRRDTRDGGEWNRIPRGDAVSIDARPRAGSGPAPAGDVGFHENILQLRGVGLESRLALEDDLVIVGWRVDGRDLPRAESVEQLLPDLVDGDAVDGRLFAIHFDRHLRVLDVEIGCDVAQSVDLGDSVTQFRRDVVQELSVAGLQRVLVLALGNAPRDVDVLKVVEVPRHSGNRIGAVAQALNHRRGIFVTLLARFERNKHAPNVCRRVRPAGAHRGIDVVDRRIGADDLRDLPLQI